jgi:hypothetical protein
VTDEGRRHSKKNTLKKKKDITQVKQIVVLSEHRDYRDFNKWVMSRDAGQLGNQQGMLRPIGTINSGELLPYLGLKGQRERVVLGGLGGA